MSAIAKAFRPKAQSVCGAKSRLIIHLVALESQKLNARKAAERHKSIILWAKAMGVR